MLASINQHTTSAENKSLRKELLDMQKSHQTLNQKIIDYSEDNQKYISEANRMGEQHLLRLCEMIKENGWLRKENVGEDGVSAIAFILENSKTVELQKEIFPVVVAAAKKGLIRNAAVATLIDSIRVGGGLPQIFGTQYEIKDELFFLYPLQNEAKTDELRKLYGLPPLWQFFKYAQSWYQMPVIKTPRPPLTPQTKSKDDPTAALTNSFSNEKKEEIVRVESNLVNLQIRIPFDDSLPTTKLQKDDFAVYENGKEQPIEFFSSGEQPIDLVLMMFGSRSYTLDKKEEVQKYARKFISAARPEDRIATFAIDAKTKSRIFTNLTENRGDIFQNAQTELLGSEATGVWSEIQFVFDKIIKPQSQPGRRSIIIYLGAGADANLNQRYNSTNRQLENSRTTFTELFETFRNSETAFIPLYFDFEADVFRSIPRAFQQKDPEMRVILEEKEKWLRKRFRQSRRTLWLLAQESGGQMYSADKPEELEGIYDKILTELRRTYSVGYQPSNDVRDGSWRSISVKIKNHPEIKAITKKGYYAK